MSDYLADGVPVDAAGFVQRACDPARSVAVEACAGSGKTWLLVSRIIRLLLAGAAPGEILAITFTRRAAQEMNERLLRELKHLAQADHDHVVAALEARGLTPTEAQRSVDHARELYERVATARVPLTMETFHGWFWRLVSRAPLGAGIPFAPTLLEASDRMRADAWLHFLAALLQPAHEEERRAWEQLVDDLGEFNASQLLRELLHKRAEWWSFVAAEPGTERQRVLAAFGPETDDPGRCVRDPGFVAVVRELCELWRVLPGAISVQQAIERADAWLAGPASTIGDWRAGCHLVLTRELTPLVNLTPGRLAARFSSAAAAERYRALHQRAIETLEGILAERRRWRARRLNAAGLVCGGLLIQTYQALKGREHALDFTDLEWHAARLLADEDHAAYMQARLDARYRHILVDEFQDTNALQWQVLQAWLAAYGPREDEAVADRPSVFIVGDPKQSIYRFRRAEPRVFRAAIDLLQQDFGGCHLRTNVTRRNAPAIVAVLNRTMAGNPLFQPQSTAAAMGGSGAWVQLPLTQPGPEDSAPATSLRDVLVTPRAERIDDTHYREGCALANEIRSWHRRLTVPREHGRPLRWSDIMVLVRRRTHLSHYERALRDAGIPFVSDRRGGLLATLEADDLVALLQFLTTPDANLRLAHALRSPVFGCSDDDLIRLASATGAHWWDRLLSLEEGLSGPLERARMLLQRWMKVAGVLPVHDLLDRIYFEGDLRRRYAASVPAALRQQVQANLDAFIELALAIDAGRFPSLPRFIDELGLLRQQGGEEAPDEGLTEGDDAVRLLTIHGAKGLEAEVVVLADTHSVAPRESGRVLVSWPPAAAAPEHVSLVAPGEAGRDPARAVWFADDDAQCQQEDWNLLYVAATRARQVLVISGSRPRRSANAANWYTTMQTAADLTTAPAETEEAFVEAEPSPVRDFLPEPIPTGRRRAEDPNSDAMRLGRGWHALLENSDPALVESLIQEHGLDARQCAVATEAAARVRAAFPGFFSIGSAAEIEIVSGEGATLRIDRLIEDEQALWIIDFKWSMADAERDAYAAQLRRYAGAVQAVRPDKPVRMGIVTSAGVLTEIQ